MNKADTAFILAAAGLVLLMPPGLALLYGGTVRRKNVLGTIMQSLILVSLVSIEWVYLGYSMSFGPDVVVVVYTFVISWILFKVIHGAMGMRLPEDAEVEGMDSTEHSETAYNN